MNKKTENSISMFKTVKAVCEANIAVITANKGITNTYNQYHLDSRKFSAAYNSHDDWLSITQTNTLSKTNKWCIYHQQNCHFYLVGSGGYAL